MRAKVRSWRLGWDALKDAIVALAHAFNLKALYIRMRYVPRARLPETDGLLGLSVLCVSNSESYCVRRSRGYFNCLATGELFKLDGLLLPVSVSQIVVFALRDRGPARCRSICRWISGPAPYCLSSAVVRLTAKRLVGKSLQLRKKYAGLLLNSIKHAKSIQLEAKSDFGKGCHTRSTEPFFMRQPTCM